MKDYDVMMEDWLLENRTLVKIKAKHRGDVLYKLTLRFPNKSVIGIRESQLEERV